MAYEYEPNHVEIGLENFTSVFRDKPNFVKFLRTLLNPIQALEDAIYSLSKLRLADAVGAQLDQFGNIVGEPRESREDDDYRVAIQARILLNTAEGTMEEAITLAIMVAGAPITVTVTEYFPAAFIMDINEDLDLANTNLDRIAQFVDEATGVAIRGILTFHLADSFQFDGIAGTGFDEGVYAGSLEA